MSVPGDLLAFFGQEMVAHAAAFVATLGAAFLFMSSLRWRQTWQGRKRSYLGRVVHFLISGGLLFLATYVLFRMLWYGQLVFTVTTLTGCDETALPVYYECVTGHALDLMRSRGSWLSFIARFEASYNDPLGLVCALAIGFSIALMASLLLDTRQN
jgi:hypothetical protein